MDKNEQKNSPDDSKPSREEDHGFYFFPNRKEGQGKVKEDGFIDNLKKGIHRTSGSGGDKMEKISGPENF